MPHIALKLAIIPAVPVSIVWLIFPLALATFIVNTPRVRLGDETPADYGLAYETVAFDNSDGDTLKGWYVPSGNGAAVILLHGAGKNRIRTLEYADIFARHGYGVLLFDRRGYGESEGSPNVFGWTGAGDVDAAVEFLDGRPDVDDGRIGALGLSVGGEIALNAIGENDGIGAVISEGAGIHVWSEYKQMPNKGIGEHIFGVSMFNAYTAIYALSGDEQPPSNLDLIQNVDRPILLISTGSGEEGEWNDLLMDEAGPNVDLWETGGGHIHGLDEKPVEYEQRVTDFLDKAFFEE